MEREGRKGVKKRGGDRKGTRGTGGSNSPLRIFADPPLGTVRHTKQVRVDLLSVATVYRRDRLPSIGHQLRGKRTNSITDNDCAMLSQQIAHDPNALQARVSTTESVSAQVRCVYMVAPKNVSHYQLSKIYTKWLEKVCHCLMIKKSH